MLFCLTNIFLRRRYCSGNSASYVLYHLKERGLIQIDGPDASEFLQGLITNDISHLNRGPSSMFTMFLNIKGRVLYDSLIYRDDENKFLIECDTNGIVPLQKHLRMYKVRRNVQINYLESHKLYALWNATQVNCVKDSSQLPQSSNEVKIHKDLRIFKDPRIASLGYRIVTKSDRDIKKDLDNIVECNLDNSSSYRIHLYKLGVGEGVNDLPPGNCLPLECNCDYLHGISFHKGCYLGQELTARTYHTGVIRKRLMPLLFTVVPTVLPEQNIIDHNNVKLGKLRGIEKNIGLGLLRVTQALEFGTIKIGNGEATIKRPEWWPIEMPKEKIHIPRV